ncbi:hypothetical protein D1BOALGB6SA_2007 [Olavius sp. associated proteobacterium Delta 1]|nr:hypothetical protein D1BOALGB6SA_2007 [Olavius sp. associated proteobacterium Delta 1]
MQNSGSKPLSRAPDNIWIKQLNKRGQNGTPLSSFSVYD